jgi:hypothetical protein
VSRLYVPGQTSAQTPLDAVTAGAVGVGAYDLSKDGDMRVDMREVE